MSVLYRGKPHRQYFHEYLDLVKRAEITLKIENDPLSDSKQNTIRFNFFESPKKFQGALVNTFNAFLEQLVIDIDNIASKYEKLNLIGLYLVEFEVANRLFEEDKNGKIHYRNPAFSNISEDLQDKSVGFSEVNIDPFVAIAFESLYKSRRVLETLQSNIQLTPASEFPVPPNLIPDKNSSTIEDPTRYFDYLINKGGISALRNSFIPNEEDSDYYDHISYDASTETRTIVERNSETGEYDETKVIFKDVLLKEIYKEFIRSKDLVDEKINQFKTSDEIKFYISVTLDRLRYLLGSSRKENTDAAKYSSIPKPLEALIRFLFEKYSSFCPSTNDWVKPILIASVFPLPGKPSLALPEGQLPRTFTWKRSDAFRLSTLLHQQLNDEFIEQCDLTQFQVAFSGNIPPSSPLIRWKNKTPNGQHTNKVTLLYLFKRLSEEGLIEEKYGTPDFFRKIEFIFRDHQGSKLTNWVQSKKSLDEAKKKTSYAKTQLETMISLLSK